MADLETSVSFNIPGPSPVGTVFAPTSYSQYSMRGITGTITNTVGQFNLVFLTNRRLDESSQGRITSLTPPTIMSGGTSLTFAFSAPTQIYQPLNTDNYNWEITAVIFLKNMANVTVDFPIGGVKNLSINIEWDCKVNE